VLERPAVALAPSAHATRIRQWPPAIGVRADAGAWIEVCRRCATPSVSGHC